MSHLFFFEDIFLMIMLIPFVTAGLYRWYPWDFEHDQFEIKYVEAFNTHVQECGLWNERTATAQKDITFDHVYPTPPTVIWGVTQSTQCTVYGSEICIKHTFLLFSKDYETSVDQVSTTGFTYKLSKAGVRMYKGFLMYMAYINDDLDSDLFHIKAGDPDVVQSSSSFRSQPTYVYQKRIYFKTTFESIPKVIVLFHGFQFKPVFGNTRSNGEWFKLNVIAKSVTTSYFDAVFEVLTTNPANVECYGGYLLAKTTNIGFGLPKEVDFGMDEVSVENPTKFLEYYTPVVETNFTDFTTSAVMYSLTGWQAPINGNDGTCDEQYTAVYSEINYDPVFSRIRFQLSGNPNPCFHHRIWRASSYWMQFKRKACPNKLYALVDNATHCECVPPYYEAQTGVGLDCISCHESCQKCDGSLETDCTACKNNMDHIPSLLGSGTCECIQPMINVEPIQDNWMCQYCHKTCWLCKGPLPDDCFQCYNNMTLILKQRDQGICTCKQLIEKDLRCYDCHYTCQTCQGTLSYECTACQNTREQYQRSGQTFSCICQAGYFDTYESECSPCHDHCQTCRGSEKTDCLICKNFELQILNQFEGSGQCGCPQGQWLDQNQCEPCNNRCQVCLNDNKDGCYVCKSDYKFVALVQKIFGSCDCLNGFFEENDQCFKCIEPCLTCTSATICIQCINGVKWDDTLQVCMCPIQFYYDDCECKRCPFPCASCDNRQCIKCLFNSIPVYDNYQCSCEEGDYYEFGQCKQCSTTCKTCEVNAYTCMSCFVDEQKRVLHQKSCICQTTYYEDNVSCLPCQYPCSTCHLEKDSTFIRCDSCLALVELRDLQQNCICISGFFENYQECLQCSRQCNECQTGPDACTKCRYNNANPIPNCYCPNYLQFSQLNESCLVGWNFTLFTYFNAQNNLQYIRIDYPDTLWFTDYDTSPNNRLLQIDQRQKLNFENLVGNFMLKTNLSCPFNYQLVSVENSIDPFVQETIITLQANYTCNFFTSTHVHLYVLNPNQIINSLNIPMHQAYTKIGVFAEVGPYLGGGMDNYGISGFSSDLLYQEIIDLRDPFQFISLLRRLRITSLIMPTIWGIDVIFETCKVIPPNVYAPMSIVISTLVLPPPQLSLQSPYSKQNNRSFSNIEHSQIQRYDSQVIVTDTQGIPGNLYKFNYTGIFLVDAADSIIFMSLTEIVHWVTVSLGKGQRAKTSFNSVQYSIRAIRQQIYRVETYHLTKLALLSLYRATSQQNSFEVLSLLISVIVLYQVLKEIFKAGQYCLIFYNNLQYTTVNPIDQIAISPTKNFLGYQLHKDQLQYNVSNLDHDYLNDLIDDQDDSLLDEKKQKRPLDYLPYNIETKPDQFFTIMFHTFTMLKRLILAILVVIGVEEQDFLIGLISLESIYIFFKIIVKPYRNLVFWLKLIGDIAYLISISMLYYYQNNIGICSGPDDIISQIIFIGFLIFIIAYMINFFIPPCLINLRIPQILPQNIVPREEVIPEEPFQEEKKELFDVVPENTLFSLSKGKIFSYSKLFNSGVLLSNNYFKVFWESEMIRAPNDLDSCGVKYVIGLKNKKDEIIDLSDLSVKLQKFDLITGETQIHISQIQSQALEKFNVDSVLDLATLDIYDDRIILEGLWRVGGMKKFMLLDYALCTSELKLIQNEKIGPNELHADQDNMFMTYEYQNFDFDPKLLDMTTNRYKFLGQENLENNSVTYITKMCTHFHLYPRLYFYLEIDINKVQGKATLKIIANKFDQDLISNSGYQQVIEHYGLAVVDFLSCEKVLEDNLQ